MTIELSVSIGNVEISVNEMIFIKTISCYPKENSVALTFSKTKLGASVTWWDQYRWQRIIILLCNLVNLYLGEMFQKSARRRREIFDKICIPKPIFLYKNRVFRRISGTKFPKNFRHSPKVQIPKKLTQIPKDRQPPPHPRGGMRKIDQGFFQCS